MLVELADWPKLLYSHESKFNLFSSDGIQYDHQPFFDLLPGLLTNSGGEARRWISNGLRKGSLLIIQNLMPFSGYFSHDMVGPIFRVKGKMDAVKYRDIFERQMLF